MGMEAANRFRLSWGEAMKSHQSSISLILLSVLLLVTPIVSSAQTSARKAHSAAKIVDVVRDPTDVPAPITRTEAAVVHVTLTAGEVIGALDPEAKTTYHYWTFNG